MKLTCENCGKELVLPDSKVPSGKAFSVKCPSCSGKISYKPGDEAAVKGTVEGAEQQAKKPDITLDIKVLEPAVNYFEEYDGTEPLALVCDKENHGDIENILKELGYRMSIAENATVAINKMKFNRYDMIIINENFDDFSLKENPVLLHIQPMPMVERRFVFVVLLGKSFKSMDKMAAFTLSVNLVVNIKDMGNIAGLLKQSIQENERFYKIFREALVAGGKI
ncbi:MAG: zinc-ribbon domain-containing protein [Nitrospinae bacterium]|nr:zinc-ribbon domain-containing protein [Nitrospinota bacterium]